MFSPNNLKKGLVHRQQDFEEKRRYLNDKIKNLQSNINKYMGESRAIKVVYDAHKRETSRFDYSTSKKDNNDSLVLPVQDTSLRIQRIFKLFLLN